MAHGSEYVPWSVYDKHLEETKVGYDRLKGLEEEVKGNEETGRPSLRSELGKRIDRSNAILISILIIILARIIIDWFIVEPKLAQLQTLELWKAQHERITKEQLRWKDPVTP